MYIGCLGLKRGLILASLRLGNFLRFAGFRCCRRCFAAAGNTSLFLASSCFCCLTLPSPIACVWSSSVLVAHISDWVHPVSCPRPALLRQVGLDAAGNLSVLHAISSSNPSCSDERSPTVCSLNISATFNRSWV